MDSKPIIICIVGQSGTGKTYIADMLQEYYDIPMIESRTTRPRRHPDEGGHLFVSETEYDTYKKEDVIAHTVFGAYRYCCLIEDVQPGLNTYVIDEDGLHYLKENFSDEFDIYSVRVYTPIKIREKKVDPERLERDKGRFLMAPDEFDHIILNNHDDTTERKVLKLMFKVEQKFN
jgi:guanylate kinase